MKRLLTLLLCGTMISWGAVCLPVTAHGVSKPSVPVVKSVVSGQDQREGNLTATWSKVSCNGYQLQYADNSSFTSAGSWSTSSGSTVNRTVTGLSKGQLYYVRVRAYKKSGSKKVYSFWSSSRSVTVHEHHLATRIISEATCNAEGLEEYSCSECGYNYQVTLSQLAHSYKKTISKAATCKSTGTAVFKCSRCGDSYSETIAQLTSHVPKTKGKKTICKICGKTITQTTTQASSATATASPETTTNAVLTATTGVASTKAGRNQLARQAAVDWAIAIANDNDFHYGRSKWAHKAGCYYCGTNQKKGSAKRRAGASVAQCEKTYCCNPFVTAAYHHGAGTKEVDCRTSSKRINLANDRNRALKNTSAWKRVSKPSKSTSLQVGDVLLTPTHAMLYVGDGKVAHAAHHDNGKRDSYWNESITVGTISSYQWRRTSKIYRYLGTGKF